MEEVQITKYEMDKQVFSQAKPLDFVVLARKINEIVENMLAEQYWMLLCHENRDYTIFNILSENRQQLMLDLRECLKNRGNVVDVIHHEDGAYEIWIKNPQNEASAYYLFNYTEGVIEINE